MRFLEAVAAAAVAGVLATLIAWRIGTDLVLLPAAVTLVTFVVALKRVRPTPARNRRPTTRQPNTAGRRDHNRPEGTR